MIIKLTAIEYEEITTEIPDNDSAFIENINVIGIKPKTTPFWINTNAILVFKQMIYEKELGNEKVFTHNFTAIRLFDELNYIKVQETPEEIMAMINEQEARK